MSRQIWNPKQKPLDSTLVTKATELRLQEQQDIKALTSMYIYNINTGEHINFPLVPDSLTDNYKSTFHVESGIFGRTTPLYFYTGGSDKTLSFSFSVHEDALDKTTLDKDIKYNLRNFLEKLLSFTEPHITTLGADTDLFKEPQVYLQIGDQFAGKGFIEVNWGYNLPYRNKRYILADVNLTFTYNIEYEPVERKLFESGIMEIEEYVSTEDLTLDLDKITGIDWKNFMPEYLSYDYIRNYTYENLRELNLNKINSSLVDNTLYAMRFLQVGGEIKFLITLPPGIYYDYKEQKYVDPREEDLTNVFLSVLHSLYESLRVTMHPSINIRDRYENLKDLKRMATLTDTAYRVSEGTIVVEYTTNRGTSTGGSDRKVFKMSQSDKNLFEQEIKKLLNIIDIQIEIVYNSIIGGASS